MRTLEFVQDGLHVVRAVKHEAEVICKQHAGHQKIPCVAFVGDPYQFVRCLVCGPYARVLVVRRFCWGGSANGVGKAGIDYRCQL